jgi:cobalt-zinc-cadmium efflux system outer membrane protein
VLYGFLAAVLAAGDQSASSLPEQLTLDGALEVFRQRGLDLLIADAAVANAHGDLLSAQQLPNPNLGYTYARILNYDPAQVCPGPGGGAAACSPNVHSFGLSDNALLTQVLSGKRGLRIEVAEAAYRAARASREDAQRTLEFQLKSQYMQAVLAKDQLDFALEVQKGWAQTLELAQLKHHSGAIAEVDEAKIEIQKLEADQQVLTAKETLNAAQAAVGFLLGVRDGAPKFQVAADLPKFTVPPKLSQPDPHALLEAAVESRPDLKALEAQVERARFSISSARRNRFPDLALNLGFNYAAPGGGPFSSNTTPPTPNIGVSGNLPVLYQQQGEIEKAEADLRAQQALYEKARAQVSEDLTVALGNFAVERDQVTAMEARLLDRALLARDKTRLQYEKGGASLLEYLDAQRTFIGTNVEYLQDLASYWIAVFQVEQAIGGTVR